MEKPSVKMQSGREKTGNAPAKGRAVTPTIRSRQPSTTMAKGGVAPYRDSKTFSRSLTRKTTLGPDYDDAGKDKNPNSSDTNSGGPTNFKKRVSTATLNDYKSLFTMFDIENKGYILMEDLLREVRAMGLDGNPYLTRAIIQIGKNRGRITLDDFLDFMCMDIGYHSTTAEIDLMFLLLDINEDKMIDADELRICAKQAGETESGIDFPDLIDCLNLDPGQLGVTPEVFRQLILGQYTTTEDDDELIPRKRGNQPN